MGSSGFVAVLDPDVSGHTVSSSSLLTSNLVSHLLGLDDGDVINNSLVEVEILGQPTQTPNWLADGRNESVEWCLHSFLVV